MTRVLADTARYRERFPTDLLDRSEPIAEEADETIATALWVTSFVVFIVGILVIWVGVLLGASMTVFARWASFWSLVPIALACLCVGRVRIRRRRRLAAAAWLASGTLLLLALGRPVALASANGGAIVFGWEG